jgi:hypothetical protein
MMYLLENEKPFRAAGGALVCRTINTSTPPLKGLLVRQSFMSIRDRQIPTPSSMLFRPLFPTLRDYFRQVVSYVHQVLTYAIHLA